MRPFVADPDFTLYVGDVRDVLAELPDESVHCVVTSPPYWALRDYGTAVWDGGDPSCDHVAPKKKDARKFTNGRGEGDRDEYAGTNLTSWTYRDATVRPGESCPRGCGAVRIDRQLGLEPTPDDFAARMTEVFREVRRVLRSDGTCWLNIGDTYNAYNGNRGTDSTYAGDRGAKEPEFAKGSGLMASSLKPKDLVGIPWRLAFALQADGWFLRSDIIWSKPNPMPESVTDRPTKAHEYVFLLAKSARYFYDATAVREPATYFGPNGAPKEGPHADQGMAERAAEARRRKSRTARPGIDEKGGGQGSGEMSFPVNVRNKRSVWEIPTAPYADAHFATFPQALVEPCVKAGTSEHGCCPECGAPWVREVERKFYGSRAGDGERGDEGFQRNKMGGQKFYESEYEPPRTLGWKPSCEHERAPVPATVLDPFMGSGTTALVARRLGRRSIGVELNPEYAALAARRLSQLSLLAEESAA